METYKLLIYSEDRSVLQKIKSSFELLPEDLVEKIRFDVLTAQNINNTIEMIDQRVFDILIIEHNDTGSNGFAVLELIDRLVKEKPNYLDTFARVILFIGPNDAKTVIKAFNHHLVTDYILVDNFKVKSLAKDVVEKLKTKKTIKSNLASTEHFLEIINYQDKLIDDLVLRIIEIASKVNELKKQTGSNQVIYDDDNETAIEIPDLDENGNEEEIQLENLNINEEIKENRFKAFDQKNIYFLDIRISVDSSITDLYLRYEIEVLHKLVLQFLSSYIEKYNAKKVSISFNRFLYVFTDQKAVNCALELCSRLAQISLSEETVLNSFKFSMGLECENISLTDDIEEIIKKSGLKSMETLMEKVKSDNTVYLSENVYLTIPDKLKLFFIEKFINKNLKYYKYSINFGK